MKSYIYKAIVASSSLLLLVSSSGIAQEANKGGNLQATSANAEQAVSRQFTFTSNARIDKPLLTIAGGSDQKTCTLWQREKGKNGKGDTVVRVDPPASLTLSNACQLSGAYKEVSEPENFEYQIRVKDGTQGYVEKNSARQEQCAVSIG